MADSVYLYDLTYADVKLPNVTIDESSDPSADTVDDWIGEACSDVNTELEAASVTPSGITSTSDANLYKSIRGQVLEWVKARIIGESLRDDPAYVSAKRMDWRDFLKDVRYRPNKRLGSSGPTNSASSFTSGVTQSIPTKLSGHGRWFK